MLLRIELADPLYRFVHPARFILCTRLKSVTWIGDFMQLRLLTFVLALLVACAPAFADDWLVIKLRGTVEQLVDTNWTALQRGDAVPDDRTVRTGPDGQVDLQRGKEVVTLGASTQVQIHDQTDTRFTTVQEDFGNVEVEAEVQNAPHFVVETQFLAAVVKGTHFVVATRWTGASVSVDRGFVAVQSKASGRSTTVTVGQTASIVPASDIVLSGSGTLPAVFSAEGTEIVPAGSLSGATHFTMPVGTGGTLPGGSIQTATLVSPANVSTVTHLRGSLGGNTYGWAFGGNTKAVVAKDEAMRPGILVGGVLIGIMIGGLALLFRRYWG